MTCGKKTEVFSRVVGYHRPIENWNKGKQEEFKDRQEFAMPSNSRIEQAKQQASATQAA